jgi:hypothetical protein
MLRLGMIRNVYHRWHPLARNKLTTTSLKVGMSHRCFHTDEKHDGASITHTTKLPKGSNISSTTIAQTTQEENGGQERQKEETFKEYFATHGNKVLAGVGIGAFTGIILKCYLNEYASEGGVIWCGLFGGCIGGICGLNPQVFIISRALTGSIAASIFIARIIWPPKKISYTYLNP